MKMVAVESSSLKKVGWENDTLFVEFNNGGQYSYDGVKVDTFISLINADSCGNFFAKNVKPNYSFVKLV